MCDHLGDRNEWWLWLIVHICLAGLAWRILVATGVTR